MHPEEEERKVETPESVPRVIRLLTTPLLFFYNKKAFQMTLTAHQRATNKYCLSANDFLSTAGFLTQNPELSDTLFLFLDKVEYLEVKKSNQVTGNLSDVKEGWYVPVFYLYLEPHSQIQDITLRATVNLTTSNLDLLVWASNTPSILQDQFSEMSLKSAITPADYGKWIEVRGTMIRVIETCSVSFYIEEKSSEIKSGILIGACYLEPALKQQQQLKCHVDGCGKVFSRPFNLKSHLETHNPTRSKNHECPECQAQFCRSQGIRYSLDLARHSQIHNRTMTFICTGCQKSFSRKDALKRHLRTSKVCPESTASK
jgi:hypothetical protein